MMHWAAWFQPEAIALYAALIMLALDLWVSSKKIIRAVVILFSVLILLSSLVVPPAPLFGFRDLRYDVFTVSARFLISLIFFLISLYLSVFVSEKRRPALFYSLVLFSFAGSLLMFEVQDLISLFIVLQISSLAAYAIAGFYGTKKEIEASLKYYLAGALASALFVFGLAIVAALSGGTSYEAVGSFFASAGGNTLLTGVAGLFLLLSAFLYKIAVFPWQLYSPDLYQGQRLHALLFTGIIPKAGGFLGLSALFAYLPAEKIVIRIIVLLSVLSWLYANTSALKERSLSRIIAFSSISHAGFMLVSLLLLPEKAQAVMVFYVFAYAISNAGLIGTLASFSSGPDIKIDEAGNASDMTPLNAFTVAASVFALAGVPPFPTFFAKFYLFKELIASDFVYLALVGLIFSAVALGYYLKILRFAYFEYVQNRARKEHEASKSAYPASAIALNVLMIVSFIFYVQLLLSILPLSQ